MTNLNKINTVVHSNYFSPMIDKDMTVSKQKLIALYLSKVNPFDMKSRMVTFTLKDYQHILGIKRYHITKIQKSARDIMNTLISVVGDDGSFSFRHFFRSFDLVKRFNEWIVQIDCTDDCLPFIFHLHREFMQYDLWNILKLNERNHQHMYRILKQYEKRGSWIMELSDLKQMLCLEGKYMEYKDFRRYVLEPCKKALAENTDISFEYEPIRKGRKVHSLKFMIYKNKANMGKPLLSEFVSCITSNADSEKQQNNIIKPFELVMDQYKPQKLENEFSKEQVIVLIDIIKQHKPNITAEQQNIYLQKKYNEMCMRKPNTSRFGYLKKMIESDDQKIVETPKRSFNVELLDRYWDKIPTYD